MEIGIGPPATEGVAAGQFYVDTKSMRAWTWDGSTWISEATLTHPAVVGPPDPFPETQRLLLDLAARLT